jgi:hypothetical protein
VSTGTGIHLPRKDFTQDPHQQRRNAQALENWSREVGSDVGTLQTTVATLQGSSHADVHQALKHDHVGCVVYRTSNQSIAHAAPTAIQFNNEHYDTDGFHDNATNNTRLTVPAGLGGYYVAIATAMFTQVSPVSAARAILTIQKNGSTNGIFGGTVRDSDPGTAGTYSSNEPGLSIAAPPVLMAAGDYLEAFAYHDNSAGAARNVYGDVNGCYTTFGLYLVGV